MEKYLLAICDDDSTFASRIVRYLKDNGLDAYCNSVHFNNGEDLLKSKEQIDILLLDIEMEETDGIKVKQVLSRKNENTKIIFLTSHEEMIHEAFGKSVYGFVNKSEYKARLKVKLQEVISEIKNEKDFLMVEVVGGTKRTILLKDILYVKAGGHYIDIYTTEPSEDIHSVRQDIKQIEEELISKGFYRIHRSYMINMTHLVKVTEKAVTMRNKQSLPISRGSCRNIKASYGAYQVRRKCAQ